MYKVFKVLRTVFGWGLLGLLALVLIVLAINARDEDLSPEAKALLHVPQNPYRPEQNIYVAMAGFAAPAGQSVVAAGQKKISRYNQQVDVQFKDPMYALQNLPPADPMALKFSGHVDCGSPRDYSFWASVRESGFKVNKSFAANRELYERYLALQHYPGYFETERASVMVDIVAPPSELRTLFLARFALLMQTGDTEQKQRAMADLGGDMDLWRQVLSGEGSLISKMLAIAYLQNDYLVLSDMIADPSVPIPGNIDSYLQKPAGNEWNIGKAFAAEYRFHSFIFRQTKALGGSGWQPPDDSDSPVRRWFNRRIWNPIGDRLFKINATENLDARLMIQLAQFSAIDPASFAAQHARYRAWEDEQTDMLKLRTLYNPTGKVLVAIGAPAYRDYLLRPYDAAALQRLVLLSLEIRRQQIALSAVPDFMKRHPEWSTHPADGGSFSWNSAAGEIAIRTVAKDQSNRRFSVRVWRMPEG